MLADAVLMIQSDVEPDRRIERAVLVQTEPGQLVVENLAVGFAEITILYTPIRNGPGDAVDELAHGGFALGGVLLAIKVLRDDDLRGQQRPRLRHLDVFLFENHLAGIIGDFGSATVPFDLVERPDFRIAENAVDAQCFFCRAHVFIFDIAPRGLRRITAAAFLRRWRRHFFPCVNHDVPFSSWLKFRFHTNHPTASGQKNSRENQLFYPLPKTLPICQFSAKPHLVGNIPTLYPTYCGDKKNFQKSYTDDIPQVITGKTPRPYCKNRNLFAAVNNKISAVFERGPGQMSRAVSGMKVWACGSAQSFGDAVWAPARRGNPRSQRPGASGRPDIFCIGRKTVHPDSRTAERSAAPA